MIQRELIDRPVRHHAVPGSQPSPPKALHGRLLAQVLVRGLAGLVSAQRCFAEEFGLAYGRVFSDGYEAFKGRTPEEVVKEWLAGGDEGLGRLQRFFDDLAQHQLALVGALDGVALEAMKVLGEKGTRKFRGGIWSPFRRLSGDHLRRQLASDSVLRHARVVLPGGAHGYVRAREAARREGLRTMEK